MSHRLNETPISSVVLTINEFNSLEEGDVLVSPLGSLFSFGEILSEYVSADPETEKKSTSKEYSFLDADGALRRIVFEGEISSYGLVLNTAGKVSYTSGVIKKIGDEVDPEYNEWIDEETGWL